MAFACSAWRTLCRSISASFAVSPTTAASYLRCSIAPENFARQFQAAEEAGASLAVLYGDEWPQLKIKNMTTGEQELIPQENLKDYIAADRSQTAAAHTGAPLGNTRGESQ